MEKISKITHSSDREESRAFEILKAIIYSSVGIFIFFIPINLNGQTTTFLYHIAYKLQSDVLPFIKMSIIILTLVGCIKPFLSDENNINKIMLISRFMTVIVMANIFYGGKDIVLISENTVLLMESIILNVATVLPLSSIFMIFLLKYGLIEIVESFFQNIMKKMFKMSGKTIINILVYIFTDCFCGFFITNSMYKNGKLRRNEANMLILNFSIVSISMMSYISDELNLNKISLISVSFFILIIMNMILCRIYPLNKKKKSYYIKTSYKETIHKNNKLKKGLNKYLQNTNKKNIFKEIMDNLEECFYIIIDLLPNIVILMIIGDIIFQNEIIVEMFQYVLNPIISVLRLPNIEEISEFMVLIFYNDIIAVDGVTKSISYSARLIIGIIAVLKGVSLTSNILYIKYTEIYITKKEFLVVFFERVILILCLFCLLHYSFLGYVM